MGLGGLTKGAEPACRRSGPLERRVGHHRMVAEIPVYSYVKMPDKKSALYKGPYKTPKAGSSAVRLRSWY